MSYLRPDAEAWLEYPKGVLGEKETPPQNATQALPSIVAWEGCDRRRYLIGDNRASKPSLRLWMSSAGREPTLPTGAPDMVVCCPGREFRRRPAKTADSPNASNGTLSHEDRASLRWIKGRGFVKRRR